MKKNNSKEKSTLKDSLKKKNSKHKNIKNIPNEKNQKDKNNDNSVNNSNDKEKTKDKKEKESHINIPFENSNSSDSIHSNNNSNRNNNNKPKNIIKYIIISSVVIVIVIIIAILIVIINSKKQPIKKPTDTDIPTNDDIKNNPISDNDIPPNDDDTTNDQDLPDFPDIIQNSDDHLKIQRITIDKYSKDDMLYENINERLHLYRKNIYYNYNSDNGNVLLLINRNISENEIEDYEREIFGNICLFNINNEYIFIKCQNTFDENLILEIISDSKYLNANPTSFIEDYDMISCGDNCYKKNEIYKNNK